MNGLACIMFIFSALIFLAGIYLYKGHKGDFTELLLWKNPQANKMTKSEIKNAGKWTMISALIPLIIGILALIFNIY
ncbi:MAG: hypothetical protein IJI58_03615 [Bacilli bacterium]|nr:hypothetical protein [Bacilli bacterium]